MSLSDKAFEPDESLLRVGTFGTPSGISGRATITTGSPRARAAAILA